ncbi:MAG: methyltransferase [Candidatus Heimdallarchaeota archaeon]|nr:methyltransferase [Candidatus Heimdallarchaeota archaeon]MCK5144778.1 methyltransferase [Candidatus Heimdallarchaeota archaeon]
MKYTSLGIQIRYSKAENILSILRKHRIINVDLEFIRKDKTIVIPVNTTNDNLRNLLESAAINFDFSIDVFAFIEKAKQPKNLFEAVKDSIPENLQKYIPKAYDIIGDIVIIDIPEEILTYKPEFGKALLSLFPSLKTVYRKASAVSGELRIREIEYLSGEKKCVTHHTEHGIRIVVDVCGAYFSPRLGHEHKRVADKCKEGEIIIDLFTGVGSFPLHIAKSKTITVHAIDINKDALKCLEKSIKNNNPKGKIILTHGDCRHVKDTLPKADRIIMNLPGKAHEYIDVACNVASPGSIIYFYQFVSDSKPLEEMKKTLEEKLNEQNWIIEEIISFEKIRESAPREIHACLEASITPQHK